MKHFILMHWIRVKHIALLTFEVGKSIQVFHRAAWRSFAAGVRTIWAVGRD